MAKVRVTLRVTVTVPSHASKERVKKLAESMFNRASIFDDAFVQVMQMDEIEESKDT